MKLRIPGPTPCPPAVLEAMGREMIGHRDEAFLEMFHRVTQGLKEFFKTDGDVLILTCSGTGGMEAAVVSTLSPGDKVLAVSVGSFGDRFAQIARAYGADVRPLNFEWGEPAEPEEIAKALRADPDIKAVLVTHNETSTGLTNDLEAIGRTVREFDKLLIVDAISSIGAIPLPVDEWGCDVVVSGSQKSWMIPPGLAMVSMNQRAWQANAQAKMSRFYLDLGRHKTYGARGETPWTPAVSCFYALDVALGLMKQEGLENILARHQRVGERCREGIKSLGLTLLPKESHVSNTVTAVNVPEGIDAEDIRGRLLEDHDILVAEGQGKLQGRIFRIGHLGYVDVADIDDVITALADVLPKVGFKAAQTMAS